MKYIRQFLIILCVCFFAELAAVYMPGNIPAGIYGLGFMFFLFMTKILKVSHIKETATFFIEIMPVMFIPAAVGLITAKDIINGYILQVLLIVIISTPVVVVVTGLVSQKIYSYKLEKIKQSYRAKRNIK